MGVYPTEKRITAPRWDEERQVWCWTEERNPYDGAKYRREVTATKWEEYKRDDCFCCSCDYSDYGTVSDPYCRNHGWAGGRACEIHNMRGTGKGPADLLLDGEVYKVDLVKLRTVQEENRHNAAARGRA